MQGEGGIGRAVNAWGGGGIGRGERQGGGGAYISPGGLENKQYAYIQFSK